MIRDSIIIIIIIIIILISIMNSILMCTHHIAYRVTNPFTLPINWLLLIIMYMCWMISHWQSRHYRLEMSVTSFRTNCKQGILSWFGWASKQFANIYHSYRVLIWLCNHGGMDNYMMFQHASSGSTNQNCYTLNKLSKVQKKDQSQWTATARITITELSSNRI